MGGRRRKGGAGGGFRGLEIQEDRAGRIRSHLLSLLGRGGVWICCAQAGLDQRGGLFSIL